MKTSLILLLSIFSLNSFAESYRWKCGDEIFVLERGNLENFDIPLPDKAFETLNMNFDEKTKPHASLTVAGDILYLQVLAVPDLKGDEGILAAGGTSIRSEFLSATAISSFLVDGKQKGAIMEFECRNLDFGFDRSSNANRDNSNAQQLDFNKDELNQKRVTAR